jgi:hypothetical protein
MRINILIVIGQLLIKRYSMISQVFLAFQNYRFVGAIFHAAKKVKIN